MVKRYEPVCWDSTGADMVEDNDGEWVSYADYKKLEDKVKSKEMPAEESDSPFYVHD